MCFNFNPLKAMDGKLCIYLFFFLNKYLHIIHLTICSVETCKDEKECTRTFEFYISLCT